MKKLLSVILAVVLMMSVLLTGCGKSGDTQQGTDQSSKDKPLKIVLLLNGTLGDKSFFDSANAGMKLIHDQLGAETKTIEMGYDQTKWQPTLEDVSDEDWDIIIAGTYQMQEYLEKVAPEHKDKKYITFDNSVDYTKGNLDNVYSILYKQNEASFLAGALAAKTTESTLPQANKDKVIGFLGGMDIPVINDFLVGYIEGAQYVDKGIKVATSYVGDFANSAKGKELALDQYNNQKVDIGFNVAGQAGLGQLDAAKASNKFAIGVDSDQAALFKDSDPAKANLVLTSVLKNVDQSLLRAIKMYKEGTLKFGAAETLGIKENAVGLAKNEFYEKNVPQDVRDYIDGLEKKILSGEIKVDTAMGMDTAKLNQIRNAVKP